MKSSLFVLLFFVCVGLFGSSFSLPVDISLTSGVYTYGCYKEINGENYFLSINNETGSRIFVPFLSSWHLRPDNRTVYLLGMSRDLHNVRVPSGLLIAVNETGSYSDFYYVNFNLKRISFIGTAPVDYCATVEFKNYVSCGRIIVTSEVPGNIALYKTFFFDFSKYL